MANDTLGRRASGLLAPPQDQGRCGSCWAFAATATYTDARSILANRSTPLLSPQYVASCAQDDRFVQCGDGCCGGLLEYGLYFLTEAGAVTAACAPYHEDLQNYTNLYTNDYDADGNKICMGPLIAHTCPANCTDGSTFDPDGLRLHDYNWFTTEAEVIQALQSGPALVSMAITETFLSYSCGVYCEDPGYTVLGYHAVEIVDYGTEDGVDFWVVKNSWGEERAEGGYFRIRRGDLELGEGGYFIPVLSPGQDIVDASSNVRTCSAIRMDNPDGNELAMSAIEHVITEINDNDVIPCPDNSEADEVMLHSVLNATTQVVDGIVIEVGLQVNVRGCSGDQIAEVFASVVLQDNDMFDTDSVEYMFIESARSPALSPAASLLLTFIVGAVFLYQAFEIIIVLVIAFIIMAVKKNN